MNVGQILWGILWIAACDHAPKPGTAVGNPGDMDVVARVLDPEVELASVQVPVSQLRLTPCDQALEGAVVDDDVILDGLNPSEITLGVPGGVWCGLTVELAGPVAVDGMTEVGTSFMADLPVGTLTLRGRMAMDDDLFLLRLDLPIEAEALDALGGDVEIPSEDPTAIAWAMRVEQDSSLWRDRLQDGVLAKDDDRLADFSVGDSVDPALAGEAGCGCASGSAPFGGGMTLGLMLWLAVRRRGTARVAARHRWARLPSPADGFATWRSR